MPGPTRRRFLEDSLRAATAALGATAFAPLTQAEELAPAGPNNTIQIACVGVRQRGLEHIRSYLGLPGVTVAAVCDVDRGVAERAARQIETKIGRKPAVYQDLRKLYDNKEIDAVSLAMPVHWHTLAAVWAMEAGKDVYVEKPVSHNVHEGRILAEVARKRGRICQAGTQSRSHPATRDAVQFIHAGGIGKVRLARGLCYRPRASIGIKPDGPVPEGVDYDLWLGPAPKRPFNPNRFHYEWHWMWDYGVGDLGNQGIHQMDIARWALNKNALPARVLALGGRFGYRDQGETPNTLLTFYEYGDADLIFEVRGLATGDLKGAKVGDIVYGSEGYAVFTANYGRVVVFDNQDRPIRTFEGSGSHFRNFIAAVRSRRMSDLNAPVLEGHLSSALCHLGNVSYRLGKPAPFSDKTKRFGDDAEAYATFARFEGHLAENGVRLEESTYRLGRSLRIDAAREKFVGDREANALLTRPYRRPFVVPDKV
jgi:predicted dehydrogenase